MMRLKSLAFAAVILPALAVSASAQTTCIVNSIAVQRLQQRVYEECGKTYSTTYLRSFMCRYSPYCDRVGRLCYGAPRPGWPC